MTVPDEQILDKQKIKILRKLHQDEKINKQVYTKNWCGTYLNAPHLLNYRWNFIYTCVSDFYYLPFEYRISIRAIDAPGMSFILGKYIGHYPIPDNDTYELPNEDIQILYKKVINKEISGASLNEKASRLEAEFGIFSRAGYVFGCRSWDEVSSLNLIVSFSNSKRRLCLAGKSESDHLEVISYLCRHAPTIYNSLFIKE